MGAGEVGKLPSLAALPMSVLQESRLIVGFLPWSLLKQKNSFEMWLITPYLALRRHFFLHLRLFPNEASLDSCLLPSVTNGSER